MNESFGTNRAASNITLLLLAILLVLAIKLCVNAIHYRWTIDHGSEQKRICLTQPAKTYYVVEDGTLMFDAAADDPCDIDIELNDCNDCVDIELGESFLWILPSYVNRKQEKAIMTNEKYKAELEELYEIAKSKGDIKLAFVLLERIQDSSHDPCGVSTFREQAEVPK